MKKIEEYYICDRCKAKASKNLLWDVYEFKRKIQENERQFMLLQEKQDIIIKLKEILYAIIDKIGE